MRQPARAWYAARCIFRHPRVRPMAHRRHLYEERLLLLRAASAEEAMRLAEREASAYAAATDAEYLGFVETFQLFERGLASGMEVFSLMRSSSRAPRAFISRYYDDPSVPR